MSFTLWLYLLIYLGGKIVFFVVLIFSAVTFVSYSVTVLHYGLFFFHLQVTSFDNSFT